MTKSTKKELSDIIDLIASDVGTMLKSEREGAEKLSKADPGEEAPAEKKPEGSSIEGTKGDDDSAPGDEGGASADDQESAPPHAEPDGDEASPADASATGDPAADASQGMDPEAIKAEIAHLSVPELQAYYLAFKDALMEKMGAGGDAGGAPEAPEASAPPAPPAPEASAPPEMGKGEMDDKSGKVTAGKMAKSEDSLMKAEFDSLKSQVETLTKALAEKEDNLQRIAAGVTKLVQRSQGQGMRKSVAGVSFVPKPGTEEKPAGKVDISKLSKNEITKKLTEVAASSTLAKSDRDLINRFAIGHEPRESIAKFFE